MHGAAPATRSGARGGTREALQSEDRRGVRFVDTPLRPVPPPSVVRARQPTTLPAVLTRHEVGILLDELSGDAWLVAVLLYGAGLRLSEALQLRIKDLDFQRREIHVRRPKSRRDRVSVLPGIGHEPLLDKLSHNRTRWDADRARGAGWVTLPDAFAEKSPAAGRDWAWQWVFPASTVVRDPTTGHPGRYHLHPSAIQRAVTRAYSTAAASASEAPPTAPPPSRPATLIPVSSPARAAYSPFGARRCCAAEGTANVQHADRLRCIVRELRHPPQRK